THAFSAAIAAFTAAHAPASPASARFVATSHAGLTVGDDEDEGDGEGAPCAGPSPGWTGGGALPPPQPTMTANKTSMGLNGRIGDQHINVAVQKGRLDFLFSNLNSSG